MPFDPSHPWLLLLLALVSFALSFLGAAVGLLLGPLRLPLIVAYLGQAPVAAACNLLISALGAVAGTFRHLRDGRVSWSLLVFMGLPSLLGALGAAYLFARKVPPAWSLLLIGSMLLLSGFQLIRSASANLASTSSAAPLPNLLLEMFLGLLLGALTAATGLMLGSLRLPMMIRWLRLDPKVAIGSNMAIGCLTGLVGAVTTVLTAPAFPWSQLTAVLLALVPPTVLGGYLGGWLTGKLRKEIVQQLAGWLIAITGAGMVVQALLPLLRP